MPRGVPVTPEQLEEIARVYSETANYSAAARAVGVDEAVARRAMSRAGSPKRAEIHARAIDRGLREGRKALRKTIARATAMLEEPLEPRDLAAVSQTLSYSMQRLADLREAPLRRAKLRAETRVADAKAKGLLPPDSVTIAVTDAARVDEVFRRAFGFEGAKEASDDAQPRASASDVGSEALPVPTQMDR